jgi:uncharacterized protein YdaT
MPWTKTNYPDSMKKLPVAIRNKAIQIANGMLKEKKKMSEGAIIATSIKNAKDFYSKNEKKSNGVSKKASVAKKKIKPVAKDKSKKVSAKKVKTVAKSKAKKTAVTKTKNTAAAKVKNAATKKPRRVSSNKAKSNVGKKTEEPIQETANNPLTDAALHESIPHGEDLHFIPEHGVMHPVTPLEAHQAEKVLHNKEEVAIQQENQKVKAALADRKNFKRFNRQTGRR